MYSTGPNSASARFERPSSRPNGAPSTVPMAMASMMRSKLTQKCGQMAPASSASTGSVARGVGSAGDCSTAASSHHSTSTSAVPHIYAIALRTFAPDLAPALSLASNRCRQRVCYDSLPGVMVPAAMS